MATGRRTHGSSGLRFDHSGGALPLRVRPRACPELAPRPLRGSEETPRAGRTRPRPDAAACSVGCLRRRRQAEPAARTRAQNVRLGQPVRQPVGGVGGNRAARLPRRPGGRIGVGRGRRGRDRPDRGGTVVGVRRAWGRAVLHRQLRGGLPRRRGVGAARAHRPLSGGSGQGAAGARRRDIGRPARDRRRPRSCRAPAGTGADEASGHHRWRLRHLRYHARAPGASHSAGRRCVWKPTDGRGRSPVHHGRGAVPGPEGPGQLLHARGTQSPADSGAGCPAVPGQGTDRRTGGGSAPKTEGRQTGFRHRSAGAPGSTSPKDDGRTSGGQPARGLRLARHPRDRGRGPGGGTAPTSGGSRCCVSPLRAVCAAQT